MKQKQYYIYLITNYSSSVIYVGVTNNIIRRIYEHKNKLVKGFSEKYNLNKLIYFEECNNVESAIAREKQIKAGSRQNKVDLIKRNNPDFKDLYDDLI